MRVVWMWVLALGCTTKPGPVPQRTSLNGDVYGRSLAGASAAFAQSVGPPRSVLVRVALRSDTCAAVQDASDPLDPNLLISLSSDQPGSYPVLAPGSTSQPAQYSTATLFTYTNPAPDFVPGNDAGLQPVVINAVGGQVDVSLLSLEGSGVLNAQVLFLMGDAGYVGQIGAALCDRVR